MNSYWYLMTDLSTEQILEYLGPKFEEFKSFYFSDNDNAIIKRKTIENYILKNKGKLTKNMYKCILWVGKSFCQDKIHFSDSAFIKYENLELYNANAQEMIAEAKMSQTTMAFKLFKKTSLNEKERMYLASYFTSSLNIKNDVLEKARKIYFTRLVKKGDFSNSFELRFVLSYIANKRLNDNYNVYVANLDGNSYEPITNGYFDANKKTIFVSEETIPGALENMPDYIQTINHECTHVIQEADATQDKPSALGFEYARREILDEALSTIGYNFYTQNYRYIDMEIDADNIGFEKALEIYYNLGMEDEYKYLKEKQVFNNRFRLPQYEYSRNEKNNIVTKEKFYVNALNKVIKNNPEYLKEFPVLKVVYNTDGSVKSFEEMLTGNPSNIDIYNDYLIYEVVQNNLKDIKLENFSLDKQNNASANIITLWKNIKYKVDEFLNSSDAFERKENRETLQKITANYNLKLFKRLTNYITKNYSRILVLNSEYSLDSLDILKNMDKTMKSITAYLKTKNANPIIYECFKTHFDDLNNDYNEIKTIHRINEKLTTPSLDKEENTDYNINGKHR